ncbi:Hypothetical predicted protein [Cloeon dipterum]|uniref:G-protein coupled receptors family 1 profile domain-containing protein n=1 Tax=Cloeon dipterum TaxID=197152 RepID=A0A8S1DJA6_9INSE|nr:Hypothetical predicted protein [Cloeon dipterum]
MTTASNYCILAATILISIITLGVNTITIFTAATKKALDRPSHKFILGLAVSDWMMGLFLPADIIYKLLYEDYYKKDTYSKYFCHCFLPIFFVLISCTSSNIMQLVIAFDRCTSVMKPVLHQNLLTKRISNRVVCAVFLFSTAVSFLPMYWNNFPNERISKSCTLLTLTLEYYSYVIVPVFVVNLVCLVFVYLQVYKVAARRLRDNAKTLKMVAVILTCHVVCWSPHMVCRFFLLSDALPDENNQDNSDYENPNIFLIYDCLLLLALSSSFLNALLYSWRTPDFKKAIKEIIYCRKQNYPLERDVASTNIHS